MIASHTGLTRLLGAAALLLAAAATPLTASADTPTQNVTVTVNESGFSPATVTIPSGGSVTWTNAGQVTHTAESVGGPSTFNTAGIGGGQSTSLTFVVPGIYAYTSGTDCLHGQTMPGFTCGTYTISVLATNGSLPGAPVGTPTPAPQTAPSGTVGSANVTIGDDGFSPAVVNLALNGTITWTNKGNNVHTATTIPDVVGGGLQPFDTGGLGPGQSSSITFGTPGTYTYYSTPDCFVVKSNGPGFNCTNYAIIVGSAPVPTPVGQAAPPTPTPINVPGANASVTIDDSVGFTPNTVTIRAGQSVGWINSGTVTHSVVINQNPQPSLPPPSWLPYALPSAGTNTVFFDSGGLGPQQTYNFTFTIAGTYPYHSSTEPVYMTNFSFCSCNFQTWKFFGTVVVTT